MTIPFGTLINFNSTDQKITLNSSFLFTLVFRWLLLHTAECQFNIVLISSKLFMFGKIKVKFMDTVKYAKKLTTSNLFIIVSKKAGMWAILTVVVVFEFTVGKSLCNIFHTK